MSNFAYSILIFNGGEDVRHYNLATRLICQEHVMNANPDTYRGSSQLNNNAYSVHKGQIEYVFKTKPRDKRSGPLRWNFICVINIAWLECEHLCTSTA